MTNTHVSGTIKALEWSQGTRKDDRKAHCECGIFAVGSDDNGGYFAILRHIDADQQCADIKIGWAETREVAMDDCEHERRTRILAAIQPDPQPVTVARVVGYGISAAMEFLTNNVLLAPFDAIKRRRKSLFYEARDTLPLSEVRRRMGYDDPR